MNQGKLEVVKQETARLNIDTLGISELKWTLNGGIFFPFIFISWRLITLQYYSVEWGNLIQRTVISTTVGKIF